MNAAIRNLAVVCLLWTSVVWSPLGLTAPGITSRVGDALRQAAKSVAMLSVQRQGTYSTRNVHATGVIFDSRGYIITNHHVANGALSISAKLFDGTILDAKVVVTKENDDLAILKVQPAHPLTALPFGSNSDLFVGQALFVIGNPYGYAMTVTRGIISSFDRDISMPSGAELRHLIQTDAAINPGNSGGPALTEEGEWIGLVVALRDGAQGIGFVIPAGAVREFVRSNLFD